MASLSGVKAICIDIGMKGSAARWTDGISAGWKPILETEERKVPTKLAYDKEKDDGPPAAWGHECNQVGRTIRVQRCFKAFIDEKYLPVADGDSLPLFTRADIHRWMRDYIQVFCSAILANIASFHDQSTWKDSVVNWVFTVPGSWAEFPTIADFRSLAEEAVFTSIGERNGSRITTVTTEARASAQWLLKNGSQMSASGYTPGSTVLSCDIGGETTDIAVCRVIAPGLLGTPRQLDLYPKGDTCVDAWFEEHVRQVLENAGVTDSMRVAEKLCQVDFQGIKKSFTGANEWITIPLQGLPETGYQVAGVPGSKSTRVEITSEGVHALLIHRDTMIQTFSKYLKGIEDAIDKVLTELNTKKNEQGDELTKVDKLSVIGICGGGSYAAYPVDHLRRRYKDKASFFVVFQEPFRPEMATVEGSTMLFDQQIVKDFCCQIRIGIKKKGDEVLWQPFREIQTASAFHEPYAMQVRFFEYTHKLSKQMVHQLVAVPTTAPALQKFSVASRHDGAMTWSVTVDLTKIDRMTASLRKSYTIVCKVSGAWKIDTTTETSKRDRSFGIEEQ